MTVCCASYSLAEFSGLLVWLPVPGLPRTRHANFLGKTGFIIASRVMGFFCPQSRPPLIARYCALLCRCIVGLWLLDDVAAITLVAGVEFIVKVDIPGK